MFLFKKFIRKCIDARIKEIERLKKLRGDDASKYAISNMKGLKIDLGL